MRNTKTADHTARMGTPKIHPAAAAGFGSNAADYVTGRPDYPNAIGGWLTSALLLVTGRTVLDLGAGTGKFLPPLIATGAMVIAVEPVAAMRGQLAIAQPGIDVRAGSADSIPLPDASVDTVVCGQAFHWFANLVALTEIRRVLKPGGTLGLVWNIRDESVDWVAALTAIMAPHEGDTPRYNSGAWRKLFPATGFSDLREQRFDHVHIGSPEHVIVDRTLSVSFIAALPAAEQAAVAVRVRDLIAATPALAGRTSVVFPYRTAAFSCQKTD